MNELHKLIARRLRELADKFDAGTSEATEGQCLDILHIVGHQGYVFNRFYADCMFMNNPIEWDEMV